MTKEEVIKALLKQADGLSARIRVGGAFGSNTQTALEALKDTNKSIVEITKTLPE